MIFKPIMSSWSVRYQTVPKSNTSLIDLRVYVVLKIKHVKDTGTKIS